DVCSSDLMTEKSNKITPELNLRGKRVIPYRMLPASCFRFGKQAFFKILKVPVTIQVLPDENELRFTVGPLRMPASFDGQPVFEVIAVFITHTFRDTAPP